MQGLRALLSLRSQVFLLALVPAVVVTLLLTASSDLFPGAQLVPGLLALMVAAALAGLLSTHFVRPWLALGRTLRRLAHGEHSAGGNPASKGEARVFAADLDALGGRLQTCRDELERRAAEAATELAAQRDRAERAIQAKSRFFAAASHDLRQPLHALSLFVGALKSTRHPPEAQTLIDNIEASTATMGLLFNALLDISQLDAGAIEPQRQHFALQAMFASLAQQFGALAAEKHLRLRFRPCAATVYSDPLLVERILGNLIANAIRYTDDGGVLVACRRRDEGLRVAVYDTGRGIPADLQESVFHEFVQLHNPARDRSQGLGLGLAIVSRLGRLLGHPIGLHSEPGRGSIFSVELPLGDPARVRSALPPAVQAQLPDDALVLLIDDESAILRGMAELFDHWNVALVTARSADEAERWLDSLERTPDVIMSDYRLSESDGIAVVARLRQRFGNDIPAILVTGDTAPETIRRIAEAGIPLLHKPLRPAKLRALLTHLIKRAAATAVG